MSPVMGLYDGDWKYLCSPCSDVELLFNLTGDPGEKHNVAPQHPEKTRQLAAEMDKWLAETPNRLPNYSQGYEVKPLEFN
jgi:hypothetical protein